MEGNYIVCSTVDVLPAGWAVAGRGRGGLAGAGPLAEELVAGAAVRLAPGRAPEVESDAVAALLVRGVLTHHKITR